MKIGQYFPHNEHGWITYFTAFQATSSALLFWSSFVTMALAIGIMPKQNVKVRRLGGIPIAANWKNDDRRGLAKGSA
jgi:hypothetical protein